MIRNHEDRINKDIQTIQIRYSWKMILLIDSQASLRLLQTLPSPPPLHPQPNTSLKLSHRLKREIWRGMYIFRGAAGPVHIYLGKQAWGMGWVLPLFFLAILKPSPALLFLPSQFSTYAPPIPDARICSKILCTNTAPARSIQTGRDLST